MTFLSFWRGSLLVVLGLVLAFLTSEIAVRGLGYHNWKRFRVFPGEPSMHETDPVLGWRNKPGSYRYPGYVPGAESIQVTVLEDGSRFTGDEASKGPREIFLLGCSFTFGHALSDTKALGWQLQQAMPAAAVRNFAVSGFSTYQALLLLEELFARGKKPSVVIYGFGEGHEMRSVAHPGWVKALAQFSRSGMAAVPWVSLGPSGDLVRHPSMGYPEWPLRNYSALMTFLQDSITSLDARTKEAQYWGVTDGLVHEMDALARRHGATLLIATIYGQPRAMARVRDVFESQGLHTLGCEPSQYPLPSSLRVPGETHPNAEVHAAWARCIADGLQRLDASGSNGHGRTALSRRAS